jgi:hypothetical protein
MAAFLQFRIEDFTVCDDVDNVMRQDRNICLEKKSCFM